MSIHRIEPGPRMSKAVVHGDTVYISGQVSEGASVTEQARRILANIDALLDRAGTDKSKLLSAQIWLADIATFDEMNAVWETWIVPGEPPARATVESRLADPKYLIEIAMVAALRNER
jgi:enamine deaminase RidA (YjgF/YER057c/UK114 family)